MVLQRFEVYVEFPRRLSFPLAGGLEGFSHLGLLVGQVHHAYVGPFFEGRPNIFGLVSV